MMRDDVPDNPNSFPPDHAALRDSIRAHCQAWQALCTQYLPTAESVWRFSRPSAPDDPQQGWKLHLSANLLTACAVLQTVAPFLQRRGVLFKAPASLQEVSRLNCGLGAGYSQIGKVISVYPANETEAVSLARRLDQLTRPLHDPTCPAPIVPFEAQYRPGSCVYYRYGAFQHRTITQPDGTRQSALQHPAGHLIPDDRTTAVLPDWVSNPFAAHRTRPRPPSSDSPLKTTYRAFRALSQRGKGGVYQAFDLSVTPPRLCLLKEGRLGGELSWDGRDGHWRVGHEDRLLRQLRAAGLPVPEVYATFEVAGNYYLATEFLTGDSLHTLLRKRQRRFSINQVLRYGKQLTQLVAQMHAAGWVWRDCKPGNLLVTPSGQLRPVDFEGAASLTQPDPLPWGTPGFSPPECQLAVATPSSSAEDLYAVGATLYLLLTGRLFDPTAPLSPTQCRPTTPPALTRLVMELLAAPTQRPPAAAVVQRFQNLLSA